MLLMDLIMFLEMENQQFLLAVQVQTELSLMGQI